MDEEKVFETSLEADAEVEDVVTRPDGIVEVTTLPEHFHQAVSAFEAAGLEPARSQVERKVEVEATLNHQQSYEVLKLLHELEECDDIGTPAGLGISLLFVVFFMFFLLNICFDIFRHMYIYILYTIYMQFMTYKVICYIIGQFTAYIGLFLATYRCVCVVFREVRCTTTRSSRRMWS